MPGKIRRISIMKNSQGFFARVYAIVKQIPPGKVTTYSQIARMLGTRDARRVGHALHANNDPATPCHRVVFGDGSLAPSFAFGGPQEQLRQLQLEGITFNTDGKVNLAKHLW